MSASVSRNIRKLLPLALLPLASCASVMRPVSLSPLHCGEQPINRKHLKENTTEKINKAVATILSAFPPESQ